MRSLNVITLFVIIVIGYFQVAQAEKHHTDLYSVFGFKTFYHGQFIDPKGQVVKSDIPYLSKVQNKLVSEMRKSINKTQAKNFEILLKYAKQKSNSEIESILLRNSAIYAVMRQKDSGLDNVYDGIRGTITDNLFEQIDDEIKEVRNFITELRTSPPPPALQEWFSENIERLFPSELIAQKYIERCQNAGVPIPPDWPWTEFLTDEVYEEHILRPNLDFLYGTGGRFFSFTRKIGPDEKGLCMALYRPNAGGNVQMAYICQNLNNGNACFWDNLDWMTRQRINGDFTNADQPPDMRLADMQNGDVLNDNCTGCHRGHNAFLIHPTLFSESFDLGTEIVTQKTKTLIALESSLENQPYQPISLQRYWNNPAGSDVRTGCQSCHLLPDVNLVTNKFDEAHEGVDNRYCDIVLSNAAKKTMPSRSQRIGWPPSHDPSSPFSEAIEQLAQQCRQ
jgi:hypothetical protein